MFTGLVETTGRVADFRRAGALFRLSITAPALAPELAMGQSVSVSGACLTVTALRNDGFDVEMMPETAERTWFGASLKPGMSVNLERALCLGGRLDGHLVLGHVDGVATLRELSGVETKVAVFSAPPGLVRGLVPKGSVALDGVSLTVIGVEREAFSVGLIPATLKGCTLGDIAPGRAVNLETDILGKYVERLLSPGDGVNNKEEKRPSFGLSIEELRELGY